MKTFLNSLYTLQPQILTIILTTIIIVTTCVFYRIKVSQLRPYEAPRGLALFIERFFTWMEDTVVETMGARFRWFTPYTIFLITYLGIGNLLSLVGFDAISSNYTIVFTLGLITFMGIYVVGVKYQKFGFLIKYVKDPTHIITQFSPLISLTFRMFGNVTAGSVILSLFYMFTGIASIKTGLHVNYIGTVPDGANNEFTINILGGILSPPFHFYFDIFDGSIQTYIFTLLTLSYIGQEADSEAHGGKKQAKKIHTNTHENLLFNENIDKLRKVT